MYVFDYYGSDNDQWTDEMLEERGFFPAGTKVRYMGKNGNEWDQQSAKRLIGDLIVTVKSCHIGGWSSNFKFEEIPGYSFNTVMFEKVE